jgi:hypothetical protein
MEILRLAAPRVPLFVKPRFPPRAEDADYTEEERAALFSS